MPKSGKGNNDFAIVLLVFFLTRITLEVVGILSMFYFPSARTIGIFRDLTYHQPQIVFVEMWARWDSEWYLMIAERGYDSYDYFGKFAGGRYLPQDSAKFFPGYPLAIRAFTVVLNNSVLTGVLLSNAASLLFLYYLFKLSAKLYDPQSARKSAVFYLVYPFSFFLSAVYSESFFLAGALASVYYIEEKNLWPGLLACAIAVLSRAQGIFLLPTLLWLAWQRFPERRIAALTLVSLAALLPLLLYFLYIDHVFGSFRFIELSQKYWRGEIRYPLYALVRFFQNDIAIHGQHNSLIDFSFAAVHLLALILSFRKIPAPYLLFSAFALLFPLSSTLFSFSRLSLANFPFFLVLPQFLKNTSFPVQIISAMLLAFFMAAFANWYWVG